MRTRGQRKTAEALLMMIACAEKVLTENGIDSKKAAALAVLIVDDIRHTSSGGNIYIAKGVSLDKALMYDNIWQDWRGNNVPELSKKYDLSEVRIYQIISHITLSQQKKMQPGLFDDDDLEPEPI